MELAWLNPALVAGALIAGLPLIVHLISRRRARRVRFAAIEFVLRSQRRTARQIRLRQILLLVARTLLLLFAALAVAQPVLRPEGAADGAERPPVALAVVIDESASMYATLDGQPAFDRAIRAARDRLLALPEDVRVFGLGCRGRPEDLSTGATFNRGALLSALKARAPSYETSDLGGCVRRAIGALREVEGDGERRVVVFSDLAAHAFAGAEAPGSGAGVVVEFVRVFDEEPPPNHGLHAVDVQRTGAGTYGGVEVSFDVTRSTGPGIDVPVDLEIEGARASRITAHPGEGATERRTLSHAFDAARDVLALEAALVAADDALAIDNEVRFPVSLVPPVRVLIVDGAPQPIPFRDEVYYLEGALSAHKQSRGRIKVDVVSPAAVTAAALVDTRVVVLANVPTLSAEAARDVVAFVKAGGGLWITCGDQMDETWFNQNLAEVLPGELRGSKGQALLDDARVAEVLGLAQLDAQHPIYRGLTGDEGTLAGLSRVQTHTLMLVEPDPRVERRVIMRFSNEVPALLERTVEAGRVILWASSIDRDWSDLAIRPGFLPLAQQILLYLARAQHSGEVAFVPVGAPRALTVPRGAASVLVTRPDGRVVTLKPDAEGVATFDETALPGIYRVRAARDGAPARDVPEARFTVVIDPRESDLTLADAAELAAAAPRGAVIEGGAGRGAEVPLWPWLLLAAIGAALLEALLVRRAAR
jgi:hypothetical protein